MTTRCPRDSAGSGISGANADGVKIQTAPARSRDPGRGPFCDPTAARSSSCSSPARIARNRFERRARRTRAPRGRGRGRERRLRAELRGFARRRASRRRRRRSRRRWRRWEGGRDDGGRGHFSRVRQPVQVFGRHNEGREATSCASAGSRVASRVPKNATIIFFSSDRRRRGLGLIKTSSPGRFVASSFFRLRRFRFPFGDMSGAIDPTGFAYWRIRSSSRSPRGGGVLNHPRGSTRVSSNPAERHRPTTAAREERDGCPRAGACPRGARPCLPDAAALPARAHDDVPYRGVEDATEVREVIQSPPTNTDVLWIFRGDDDPADLVRVLEGAAQSRGSRRGKPTEAKRSLSSSRS